jgi:hypothetical protein
MRQADMMDNPQLRINVHNNFPNLPHYFVYFLLAAYYASHSRSVAVDKCNVVSD